MSNKIMYLEQLPLHIPVKVLKTRTAYGRQDLLVTPILGYGKQWVSANRVIAKTPPQKPNIFIHN